MGTRSRVVRSRVIRSALIAFGVLAVLFFAGVALLVISGLRNDVAPAGVALVLGNKVEVDGQPSPRLRARLDETLVLYRSGYFPTIITSGGLGREGYDEAVVMRDYLVAHGVPTGQVILDSDGTTTFASARNAARIMRERNLHSVFVVSQYFHLPRCRLALQRSGISQVHSAHPRWFEWRDLYSIPREVFGYLSYQWRTYPPLSE